MLRLLSLCLLQVLIVGLLLASTPSVSAQEAGIRIRGPKSTDVFPHERYGPITNSDTLWKIALTIRPDPSVTVYQVMQALFEMNPNAFADNNRNHLVNGQYLLIPSLEKIRLIDPYSAKNTAESDDKKWQGKVAKKAKAKAPVKPEELVVKKKDLDAAKGEINQQLQTFDTEQRQKLDTIQQDVLDSIDGLQAILQENEILRKRLANFNDQLTLMQSEVAKGQEVKAQLDSMIQLQKELLAKAEERERQLLLEKQQAELEQQNWMSSLWFKILMGTLPALLIAGVVAFFIGRKKQTKEEPLEELTLEKPAKQAEAPMPEAAVPETVTEAVDDELSLDGELSLDDELSIDLAESEDESDDLFSDDIDDLGDDLLDDDLTDEVIHLDDELDELDDLEDISLDDDLEIAEENEELEGGELDQNMLDDLLSGDDASDAEQQEEEGEALEGGQLDQGDLDDLLSGLGTDDEAPEDDSEALPDGELGQDDLDALLASATEEAASEEVTNSQDSQGSTVDNIPEDADVTDPDDIDALLDSVDATVSEAETNATEANAAENTADDIPDGTDVTDPDDIDALLDSINGDSNNGDTSAAPETSEPETNEPETYEPEASAADDIPDGADVTDPDDIDALLASINSDSNKSDTPAAPETSEPETYEPEASAADDIPDGADVTDPDDIDALLASINGDTPATPEASEPEANTADDSDMEITDPDDIDALLNSINGDSADPVAEPDGKEADGKEAELAADQLAENIDVNDASEIEQLLDTDAEERSEHHEQIEAFTEEYVAPFLNADFSDILVGDAVVDSADEATSTEGSDLAASGIDEAQPEVSTPIPENNTESAAELSSTGEISDDIDIDNLIADVQSGLDDEQLEDSLDSGDELLADINMSDASTDKPSNVESDLGSDFDESTLSELLNDEKDTDATVELSPDFTDSNVLADLLADGGSEREDVAEANEIEDIQELDSLDFDELLANIEEESVSSEGDSDFDLSSDLDIGDELVIEENANQLDSIATGLESELEIDLLDEMDQESNTSTGNTNEDFVSVDDLLSDSLQPIDSEPYEKTNIDVGLDEFPEFAEDANKIDVDEDDNGMSAKIDLAKVYIEIGDNENAEVILADVLASGDAQQKLAAQQLLDNLK